MEMIARPLLVLSLTDDIYHLGLILVARGIPQITLGIFAGVIADWYNRRTVLLVAKTGSAAVNFALAALILSGQVELWHLYATTIIKGLFTAIDQPARESLIPSLVPRELVTSAVALNSATMNTMRIAGWATGGVLFAIIGAGWTFFAVSVIFLGAVYFTIQLRVPPQPKVENKSLPKAFTSLKEGLYFAWTTPSIRWVIALAMIFFAFGMAYMQVFLPLFTDDEELLDIGGIGFGLMGATSGLGALTGALIIATINPSRHRGLILIGAMVLFSTSLIFFSLSASRPWLPLSFLFIGLVGMGQTTTFALNKSILLGSAPADMRGRIIAILNLDRSMNIWGGAMAGFAAAAIGVQSAQIYFAAACLVGVLLMAILVPALRKID